MLVNCASNVEELRSLQPHTAAFSVQAVSSIRKSRFAPLEPKATRGTPVNSCSARWVSPKEEEEKDGTRVSLQPQQLTAFSHHCSQICLGEKAKEEVNRVEILSQEERKPAITIATLKASVLPMVSLLSLQAQGSYHCPNFIFRWART